MINRSRRNRLSAGTLEGTVAMVDEMKLRTPAITEISVNFPFTLVLEHPPIDLKGMFELSQAFDMYEMEKDSTNKEGTLVKDRILVDILECTPTQSTIKVTPAEAMSYAEMSKHAEAMIQNLSKRLFKSKAKVAKLTWEIDKTGVASDLRGMLRKVS